jgi:hypothetical protein
LNMSKRDVAFQAPFGINLARMMRCRSEYLLNSCMALKKEAEFETKERS